MIPNNKNQDVQVNKAPTFFALLSSLQPIVVFLLIAAGVAWYLTVSFATGFLVLL